MIKTVQDFWIDEEGQDLIEYSLVIAFLSLVTVGLAHSTLSGIWSTHQ